MSIVGRPVAMKSIFCAILTFIKHIFLIPHTGNVCNVNNCTQV
jgi:hypothetical protein